MHTVILIEGYPDAICYQHQKTINETCDAITAACKQAETKNPEWSYDDAYQILRDEGWTIITGLGVWKE